MSLDPDRVSTVTVDSHGTIVDVSSAADALDPHVDDPSAVAATWRGRSLTYAAMANYLGHYQPFWTLVERALTYALETHGVELDAADREAVLAAYHELDVFPDVQPAIERLAGAGYDLYVVSNASPAMLRAMVEHAGLEDWIVDTISADEVEAYKVAPALYRHAAGRAGTPVGEIAHVSAGWFDACGAKNVGMQGVWVNRADASAETWGPTPDVAVGSFGDLADQLGA